jgi:hypothetical protein
LAGEVITRERHPVTVTGRIDIMDFPELASKRFDASGRSAIDFCGRIAAL